VLTTHPAIWKLLVSESAGWSANSHIAKLSSGSREPGPSGGTRRTNPARPMRGDRRMKIMNKHISGRAAVIAGLAGLTLAAAGTAAGAALAGSPVSSGVVYGCYTTQAASNGSHSVVLENAGTACPKGSTAITWNQTGPAGATGPVGPAGPAGPAGASTAGPSGLDVTTVTGSGGGSTLLGDPAIAEAICPTFQPYILGGGFESSGSASSDVTTSMPVEVDGSQGGWEAVGTPATTSLTVYAICSK
jgi:hypothetical protein